MQKRLAETPSGGVFRRRLAEASCRDALRMRIAEASPSGVLQRRLADAYCRGVSQKRFADASCRRVFQRHLAEASCRGVLQRRLAEAPCRGFLERQGAEGAGLVWRAAFFSLLSRMSRNRIALPSSAFLVLRNPCAVSGFESSGILPLTVLPLSAFTRSMPKRPLQVCAADADTLLCCKSIPFRKVTTCLRSSSSPRLRSFNLARKTACYT